MKQQLRGPGTVSEFLLTMMGMSVSKPVAKRKSSRWYPHAPNASQSHRGEMLSIVAERIVEMRKARGLPFRNAGTIACDPRLASLIDRDPDLEKAAETYVLGVCFGV